MVDTKNIVLPPRKVKKGKSFSHRQGQVFADLLTKPGEWSICGFDGLTFDLPANYCHVDTRYSRAHVADSTSYGCQLCGHKIRNLFYIKHDQRQIYIRVGSSCVESFIDALTPDEQFKFKEVHKARVKKEELEDLERIMVQKGWEAPKALIALRAWRAVAKKFNKNYPAPSAQLDQKFQAARKSYWTIRKDLGRKTAWSWWIENRPVFYAYPAEKLLVKCWKKSYQDAVKEKVEKELTKHGYTY